jgi:hypothetical protein
MCSAQVLCSFSISCATWSYKSINCLPWLHSALQGHMMLACHPYAIDQLAGPNAAVNAPFSAKPTDMFASFCHHNAQASVCLGLRTAAVALGPTPACAPPPVRAGPSLSTGIGLCLTKSAWGPSRVGRRAVTRLTSTVPFLSSGYDQLMTACILGGSWCVIWALQGRHKGWFV